MKLPTDMSEGEGFALWFLNLGEKKMFGYVCPDSMSFVTDASRKPKEKRDWLRLSSRLQVCSIITTVDQLVYIETNAAMLPVRLKRWSILMAQSLTSAARRLGLTGTVS